MNCSTLTTFQRIWGWNTSPMTWTSNGMCTANVHGAWEPRCHLSTYPVMASWDSHTRISVGQIPCIVYSDVEPTAAKLKRRTASDLAESVDPCWLRVANPPQAEASGHTDLLRSQESIPWPVDSKSKKCFKHLVGKKPLTCILDPPW